MSLLNNLTSITHRSSKRVGRGIGSTKGGHTASRGMKGQKSRTGGKVPLWFEGGALPLIKRIPMLRGKGKLKPLAPSVEITLTELNNMSAETISLATLKEEKIIDPRFKKAKVINSGEISRAVTLIDLPVTAGAKTAIEKAGGKV